MKEAEGAELAAGVTQTAAKSLRLEGAGVLAKYRMLPLCLHAQDGQ